MSDEGARSDRTVRVAGIDVGSAAVKVAILDVPDDGTPPVLLATRVERLRRRDPQTIATEAFEGCLEEASTSSEALEYVATTGEGECVSFRTGHFYGMTTHARGGLYLEPEARCVIDIGSLHTRAILMDARAKVLGYRMTSQCASGSGQFLENICRYLGITVDEIGPLSLRADAPESCSSICAVLAETDVINMVSRGITAPNIIRGIHDSMAGRCVKLVGSLAPGGPVLVTGGLAADTGLLASLNEAADAHDAGFRFLGHPLSVLAGAIGAALWGAFRLRRLAARGISLGGGAAA